jgi:hypothetical protein
MTEKIGLQAVLDTSDFDQGVKLYNSAIDAMVSAGDDMSASAKSQITSLTDLAQVLSNAGPAKLAATAIDQLQQEFSDGKLTAEQYANAVTMVQDEFGLVSPTGKAAAGALTELNRQFQAGEISAEEYAEGLKNIDTAQDESGKSAVELAAQIELVEKAYDAVKSAVGEAIELAELGVQAERVEERFRAFAGEIGDADELLAAFQRGAGGTVDKMTAMSSAAKLLQMGLVQNNDEMEMVVEIATRLGDQTQSAGDRVADFALLLANQSIPRLDNFGISSGKVRARIEELQKAFPGMSREAAFSQAVFEEGSKSLDILGERTMDAGAKMEMARAKIADMRVEMGQRLLPIVATAFGLIENLNSGTMALVAVMTGAAGALIKFGGGLAGASEKIGTLATKLGTSTAALGALAAATVVLVEVAGNLKETLDGMSAAQDNAQAAAGTLGDQVSALVADGMSLEDAMAQVGDKVENATAKFNDATVLGVIPLSNAFNAGSEFAKTMAEAQSSLQGVLVANTETHGQYVEQVIAYNATLDEGTEKLWIMSEAEFDATQKRQAGIGPLTEIIGRFQDYTTTLTDVVSVVETDYTPAWMTAQRVEEGFSQSQAQASQRMQDRERALGSLSNATEDSTKIVAAAAREAENRASIEEKAARIEDMQATSALASAAALEEKRQKDIATVQAEQDLAQSVMNASDAMIAQTFIQGLDPEAMGLTAYKQAVEDIQLAFGLATPESIKLAHGITQGIDAANAGEIAYGDLDQFINDLIADSETGADTFAKYGIAIDDSASASDSLVGSSQALGIELAGINDDAMVAVEGMDSAAQSADELDAALSETAAGAGAHGAAIASNLGGALDAGMRPLIDSFKGKLQELRDALPGSEPKDTTSPLYELWRSGDAIIGNIADGMENAGDRALRVMYEIGEGLGGALGSAIKSNTEDLVGDLFSAAGTLGGLGGTAASLFQKRVLDPLTTHIEGRQQGLDEMNESMEELVERQGEMRSALDEMGPLDWVMLQYAKDSSEFSEEQVALIEEYLSNQHERARLAGLIADAEEDIAAYSKEAAEQQERLLRYQEQQENLRFLQQQADLLALIAEHGLDASAILGGLQLGIDADAGQVMDAMAAAMQAIIAQAEEELGIASPSKVFEKIGAETMSGLALGIERLMSLPVAQSAIATQAMIAAPASVVTPRNNYTDNSRSVGPISIEGRGGAGQMSDAQLVSLIRQVVNDAVRGR